MIQWYPGHMAKTKREIKENLKLIDIVYFVLDARCPFSSFNEDILAVVENKPILYLYNKSSLSDYHKLVKLNLNEPYLIIDSLKKININKITFKTRDILAELLKTKTNQGYSNYQIKALVMGIPNVGKSTLINTLTRAKKASTNPIPGHTRRLAWIRTKDDILLLDTPGVLWPKLEEKVSYHLALSGAIKEEIIKEEKLAYYGLRFIFKYYPHFLKYYDIEITKKEDFFEQLQEKRGLKLLSEAYTIFLRDLKEGKLGAVVFDRDN